MDENQQKAATSTWKLPLFVNFLGFNCRTNIYNMFLYKAAFVIITIEQTGIEQGRVEKADHVFVLCVREYGYDATVTDDAGEKTIFNLLTIFAYNDIIKYRFANTAVRDGYFVHYCDNAVR